MSRRFDGKWSVVTGALNEIGIALANKCMSLGINVVLIDDDENALSSLKSKCSSQHPSIHILSYKCDCSNEEDIKEMIASFKRDCGSDQMIVHFLFNNIGISPCINIINDDLNNMHQIMNTNLWSTVHITQAFLPFLKRESTTKTTENDDRFIINTSSIASLSTANSFYAVTMHGINALSQTFQNELTQYNKECIQQQNGNGLINVSCVIPSYIESSKMEEIGNKNQIKNVLKTLNKAKANNLGMQNPEMWKSEIFDPSILADVIFEQAIKNKQFWVHSHLDWSRCVALDRFYTFYTQKSNQYEGTRKILDGYKQNIKEIQQKRKKAKL